MKLARFKDKYSYCSFVESRFKERHENKLETILGVEMGTRGVMGG